MSEFDSKDAIREFNKYEKGLFCADSFIRGARWQFDQLKAEVIAYKECEKNWKTYNFNLENEITALKAENEDLKNNLIKQMNRVTECGRMYGALQEKLALAVETIQKVASLGFPSREGDLRWLVDQTDEVTNLCRETLAKLGEKMEGIE